jgi:redox-sensitive bicupin YhaK (pirin superfamily)
MELLEGRRVPLVIRGTETGGMLVNRTLPNKTRRMVGAWCFLDAYGPDDVAGQAGMRVAPHPHTGLQTVTWLGRGEVLHTDSLGSTQLIRPGQLNLMTAGRAIAHAEQSPPAHGPVLEGVQLWVALPGEARAVEPWFAHHAGLPQWTDGELSATVIMGALDGAASPARTYTPLVGAEVTLAGPGRLPLQTRYEYAVLALAGSPVVDGVALDPGPLLYLGAGRSSLPLDGSPGARLLLLGGEPFEEELVMWWNFVGRSHEEIVDARARWEEGSLTGAVHGYDGDPIPAPPLPTTRLKARGRVRTG